MSEAEEPKRPRPEEMAERGIQLCREGRLEDGLHWLAMAAKAARSKKELPALGLAYLGYGMAKVEGERAKGLQLCRMAVKREFYQPEAYVLLARVYLMRGDRKGAHQAIEKGLEIDPESTGLHRLKGRLGNRRPPVLPMLSRSNPLNRFLGSFRGSGSSKAAVEDDDDPGRKRQPDTRR